MFIILCVPLFFSFRCYLFVLGPCFCDFPCKSERLSLYHLILLSPSPQIQWINVETHKRNIYLLKKMIKRFQAPFVSNYFYWKPWEIVHFIVVVFLFCFSLKYDGSFGRVLVSWTRFIYVMIEFLFIFFEFPKFFPFILCSILLSAADKTEKYGYS